MIHHCLPACLPACLPPCLPATACLLLPACLPPCPLRAEVEEIVAAVVTELKASSVKDMGSVMKAVTAR